MIKALFFDLDGTLLNDKREIMPQTLAALHVCKENGVKLFVATARMPFFYRLLSWDTDTISLFDGGIYYNGGCIDLEGRRSSAVIPNDLISKVLALACSNAHRDLILDLENEEQTYRYRIGPELAQEEDGTVLYDQKAIGRQRSQSKAAAESLPVEQIQEMCIVKILAFHANMVDTISGSFLEAFESLCKDKAQLYLTDQDRLIQIMANGVSKVNGIEKIRQALGVAKEEIAVFGDDIPDLDMLAAYPNSVAPANAHSLVKEAARYVVPDNNSEGIYYALTEVLKLVGHDT